MDKNVIENFKKSIFKMSYGVSNKMKTYHKPSK